MLSDTPPTILLDEADTIFGQYADGNEDLRGLLNAGHQRNRLTIRWDASTRTLERIPTFAMAALAGIGAMPDTIEDRAVVIRMRRAPLAARTGASTKELMARMGHDSAQAALIYQHATAEADREIAARVNAATKAEQKRARKATSRKRKRRRDDPEDGAAGTLAKVG